LIRPLLLPLLVFLPLCCGSWGFAVHRDINGAAVDALEEPLRSWLAPHRSWLSEHAVDADKRKRMVEREAPRHYVDLDASALACLDSLDSAPWFSKAVEACGEDSLWAYGVLPWNIEWAQARLVEAMDGRDREAILRAAADLGHYAADAHVPLHTTLNYNGQLTNQDGIHSLWETRLPERYGHGYFLAVPKPEVVSDVGKWAWETIRTSHAAVDSVLGLERELVEGWEGDLVVREQRGRTMQLQRVPAWCDAYHAALDGMVERRWRQSIYGVASLWTTAWVEAGQPDLRRTLRPESKGLMGWWGRWRARNTEGPDE
jgi:hypothetical protein